MDCIRKVLRERPITRSNVFHYYLPLASTISYNGLGIGVIQPNLLKRLSPTNDLTNFFLATSIGGSFLFLYDRKHLQTVPSGDRWKFSLLGSAMFNLGSLLLWAIIRSATVGVDAPQFKFFIAISTAYGMLTVGLKYLTAIDSQLK